MADQTSIAIVGMACRYPDADDPAALLDSVLTGRRAFRRLPPGRVNLDDYYQPDPGTPDATYSTRAALIEGWEFDYAGFGVRRSAYLASDPVHWLALETATRALEAAGLGCGDGLDRDRTGVIFGNTLTGDFSRANAMRVRWPYVRRALARALTDEQVPAAQASTVLMQAERSYLAPFPAIGPYSLAGSLPATIPATVSAYFGFRGGSHAVDAACSSSLQAVASACAALAAGDLDAAIVGGVDVGVDPLELIGLARAGVLAATDVRIYDEKPSGYLPGEGCGALVLTRAADARAAGLTVHAEILGWGTSAGTLPGEEAHASSQLLAMRRAYDRAGVDPADVHYLEGNGVATLAADESELSAIASIRTFAKGPAVLGSVKANIGHAGAAAGAAGLIKTVLAASAGVLPPATGADRPHALIAGGDARVELPAQAREWPGGSRLAAVSTSGIGGSNVHIVLRHEPAGRLRRRRADWLSRPASQGDRLAEPAQAEAGAGTRGISADLRLAPGPLPTPFLLHAPHRQALAATLARLADRARWLSDAEMADLACSFSRDPHDQGPVRVALVATRQQELSDLAGQAQRLLSDLADGQLTIQPGIFAADGADGRVTLLLSGSREEDPDTLPAAAAASLDALRWLDSLEVHATAAVGHGLGVLAGLAWAGVLGEPEVSEIAGLRARFLLRSDAADTGAQHSDVATLRAAIAQRFRFGPPRRRLISTVTGSEIGSVDDAIDLVCGGFAAAGRVAEAIRAGAVGATLLLETGPGHVLADAASGVRAPALSLESGFLAAGLTDPLDRATAAAALFAAGALGDPQALFADQPARPLDLWREQVFLTSPCERALEGQADDQTAVFDAAAAPLVPHARAPEADTAGPDAQEAVAEVPPSTADGPVPAIAPWVRCFAQGLRPAQDLAEPASARDWRIYAAARDSRLASLAEPLRAEPSARRTLAIVEDPADERSRATALEAARDAITTGELVVVTTSAEFSGFFASLHAEHPSMGITVLRVPPAPASPASPAAVTPLASAEPGRFRELVVGPAGEVSEPVPVQVAVPGGGDFPLGSDDVIVISRAAGGAGLALARVLACSGTAVAVVGRATGYDDSEFIAGLEELRQAGARIGYEVIDTSDPRDLAGATRRIEARLGPVTAIAHASTPDEPVPVLKITDGAIRQHPAGQIATLDRLAGAVAAGQLKLVVSIGTVAGRYGLAGAGLHALSNGALASHAAALAASHGCRAVHLDMPPWTAGGFGERPDFTADLAAAGTGAVDLAAASRLLLKIMTTPGVPPSLAVHGRIGGLASRPSPVITPAELVAAGLPRGGRFLRETDAHCPGIELVCTARLSPGTDPYLADYRVDGTPVLPPGLALEALAQAASVLAGRPLRRPRSVRLDAPVLIPARGEAVLRVCAQRDGDLIVAVLRSAESSYQADHARAEFSCAEADAAQLTGPDLVASPEDTASPEGTAPSGVPPLGGPGGLVDGAELYGPVCFQSGRFRRIALLPEVTARSGRALARGSEAEPWFPPGTELARAGFLLGSPGLNDAALQVLQACVPHRRVRAFSCESVQFSGRAASGPVEIRAIARPARSADGTSADPRRPAEAPLVPSQPGAPDAERTGRPGVPDAQPVGRPAQRWDVDAVAADGRVLVAWRGLELRDTGPLPRNAAWPPALLSVFLERMAADLGLNDGLRVRVSCGDPDRPSSPRRRPAGAASAPGSGLLEGFALQVRAPVPAACGWAAAEARPAGQTRPHPASGLAIAYAQLTAGLAESPAETLARLQAIQDCLTMAGLPADEQLTVARTTSDGWAVLETGRSRLACVLTNLSGVATPVAIAVLTTTPARPRATSSGAAAAAERHPPT